MPGGTGLPVEVVAGIASYDGDLDETFVDLLLLSFRFFVLPRGDRE